ncbi:hypothetical protein PN441_20090 [Spirulina major CS-329]|uniref:YciI family protein n=1 Tax=Spirulina TaxID=1154 RepID=UPI00232CD750|nr:MULTISPECIES: hypothetical protein [Spirulina]MDB9493804.1 hypothetical protein [Spirulina subsalsa CS-330]MDB9505386.1 hypothetical protein [Spirulina major CS-329]
MPWFVKLEKGIVEKSIFDRHVPAHRDYVQQLIANGHQAKTGYWGDYGGGMLLFWAESRTAAEAIVENDPLIQNQCVQYELHEWCIVVQ